MNEAAFGSSSRTRCHIGGRGTFHAYDAASQTAEIQHSLEIVTHLLGDCWRALSPFAFLSSLTSESISAGLHLRASIYMVCSKSPVYLPESCVGEIVLVVKAACYSYKYNPLEVQDQYAQATLQVTSSQLINEPRCNSTSLRSLRSLLAPQPTTSLSQATTDGLLHKHERSMTP